MILGPLVCPQCGAEWTAMMGHSRNVVIYISADFARHVRNHGLEDLAIRIERVMVNYQWSEMQ